MQILCLVSGKSCNRWHSVRLYRSVYHRHLLLLHPNPNPQSKSALFTQGALPHQLRPPQTHPSIPHALPALPFPSLPFLPHKSTTSAPFSPLHRTQLLHNGQEPSPVCISSFALALSAPAGPLLGLWKLSSLSRVPRPRKRYSLPDSTINICVGIRLSWVARTHSKSVEGMRGWRCGDTGVRSRHDQARQGLGIKDGEYIPYGTGLFGGRGGVGCTSGFVFRDLSFVT